MKLELNEFNRLHINIHTFASDYCKNKINNFDKKAKVR